MLSVNADKVKKMMKENLIFLGLLNDNERSNVLRLIKSIKCMILSLRTFFKDMKYIKPCCLILKTLTNHSKQSRRPKQSLWEQLSGIFIALEVFRV